MFIAHCMVPEICVGPEILHVFRYIDVVHVHSKDRSYSLSDMNIVDEDR